MHEKVSKTARNVVFANLWTWPCSSRKEDFSKIFFHCSNYAVKCIRENEEKLCCNIPWALTLQIDTTHFNQKKQRYHNVVLEGENLGVYVWILLAPKQPLNVLYLAKKHTDSAFWVFCKAGDLSAEFLDEVTDLPNVMPVPCIRQFRKRTVNNSIIPCFESCKGILASSIPSFPTTVVPSILMKKEIYVFQIKKQIRGTAAYFRAAFLKY